MSVLLGSGSACPSAYLGGVGRPEAPRASVLFLRPHGSGAVSLQSALDP